MSTLIAFLVSGLLFFIVVIAFGLIDSDSSFVVTIELIFFALILLFFIFLNFYLDTSKVYEKSGLYGFRTPLRKFTPPIYKNIDTIDHIFTYSYDGSDSGIDTCNTRIFIATNSAGFITLFRYKTNRGEDELHEIVHNCDSMQFIKHEIRYWLPNSKKWSKRLPIYMIRFYKNGKKNTINYMGDNSYPRLIREEEDPV